MDVLTVMSAPTHRYLSEHVDVLPLGVPVRLVATHDAPLGLLALLDRPPWERRRSAGLTTGPEAVPNPVPDGTKRAAPRPQLERFEGGRWRVVAAADRVRLAQPATQARPSLAALPGSWLASRQAWYAGDQWSTLAHANSLQVTRPATQAWPRLQYNELSCAESCQVSCMVFGVLSEETSRRITRV